MNRVNLVLRRWMIVPGMIFALFTVQLAFWVGDRKPPFAVLSVAPAQVEPGRVVRLDAVVRRDVGRMCSATFTRYLYDGAGYRHDLEGVQRANATTIRSFQTAMPGRLSIALPIPEDAVPGQAALMTDLDYVCNPVHYLWPIGITTMMPFTIAPKGPR